MNPTITDWLQAVGTVGAFVFAVGLFARELQQRRNADARRVSAWAAATTNLRWENEFGARISQTGGGKSVHVIADNRGETPVYDFQVWVHAHYGPDASRHGTQGRTLPPGQSDVWADGIEIPGSGLAGHPYVDISFQDANGNRWQRLYDGSFGHDVISRSGRSSRSRLPWRRAGRRSLSA